MYSLTSKTAIFALICALNISVLSAAWADENATKPNTASGNETKPASISPSHQLEKNIYGLQNLIGQRIERAFRAKIAAATQAAVNSLLGK